MDYLMDNLKFFSILCVVSVFCTVMFTEIVKKFDKNDRLKGYKVWLPLIFSSGFSVALKYIFKIDWLIFPFVISCVFGFSVFGYEVVLKSINRIIEKVVDKINSKIDGKTKEKTETAEEKAE